MDSITIISATNRPDSHTQKVANHYYNELKMKGVDVSILSLEDLPQNFLFSDLYGSRSSEFQKLIDTYIDKQNKFIFVAPEYNGSFAGVLKVFLDAVSPRIWVDKKACLVGVATGRAGNLRGMEHLTNILNYLKIHVHYNKLPLSRIDQLMDEKGIIFDVETKKVIDAQLNVFIDF
jgi:chromate reductase